jgi:CHAD domain-containing protein
MEHALSHVIKEFEEERDIIGNIAREELDGVRMVVRRLRSNLSRKTIEMKHIKVFPSYIRLWRSIS